MKIKRDKNKKQLVPVVEEKFLSKFNPTEVNSLDIYKGVSAPVIKQLLNYLKIDLTVREACKKVGLDYVYFKSMLDNNVNGIRHLVDQAELAPKIHHLKKVHLATKGYQASMWWLERACREKYGKEVTIRRTEDDKQVLKIGDRTIEF